MEKTANGPAPVSLEDAAQKSQETAAVEASAAESSNAEKTEIRPETPEALVIVEEEEERLKREAAGKSDDSMDAEVPEAAALVEIHEEDADDKADQEKENFDEDMYIMTDYQFDSSAHVTYTYIFHHDVACFHIGGEARLNVHQFLERCLPGVDEGEVSALMEDLGIYVTPCDEEQLKAMKAANSIKEDAVMCGLIRRSDAERIISELLCFGHELRDGIKIREEETIGVKTTCISSCKGDLYREFFPGPCIRCRECAYWFEPWNFLLHHHAEPKTHSSTVHWGLDPRNWQRILEPTKEVLKNEKLLEKYCEFVICPYDPKYFSDNDVDENDPDVLAVRAAQLNQEVARLVAEMRREHLVKQAEKDEIREMLQPKKSAAELEAELSQELLSFASSAVVQRPTEKKSKCVDVIVIDDEESGPSAAKQARLDLVDEPDDTLDRMLEENLREPALSRIRCKIADSQRALMKRIDELTMERDSVHIQKLVLQQNYNLLSSYFQLTALTQQSQQPINSDKLLMNQLMMNAAATSGNLGPAPPVTSNFGAPAALATADPSTTAFNNLIAQLLNSPSASLNGGLGSMAAPMTQQNLSFEKAKLFLPNGTIDPSVLLGSINGSA